jgi:hypothetical protein
LAATKNRHSAEDALPVFLSVIALWGVWIVTPYGSLIQIFVCNDLFDVGPELLGFKY